MALGIEGGWNNSCQAGGDRTKVGLRESIVHERPVEHPMIYIIDDESSDYRELTELANARGILVDKYSSMTAFLSSRQLVRPCCIISELSVRDEFGMSLLVRLEEHCWMIPVIFYAAELELKSVLHVMERGALTVLKKPASVATLMKYALNAIERDQRQTAFDEVYCNVTQILERLTERQKDILDCMVHGYPTHKIAGDFQISQRLVEKERSEILRQFQVTGTPDVTLKMGEYRAIKDLWNHPRWRASAQ